MEAFLAPHHRLAPLTPYASPLKPAPGFSPEGGTSLPVCVSHRTLANKRHVWYQPRHCMLYSKEGSDSEEPLFQKEKAPIVSRDWVDKGREIGQPGKLPRSRA
jgi:hypothetical protein